MLQATKKVRVDFLLSISFVCLFILMLSVVSWISYILFTTQLAENTSHYQQELLQELNKQINLALRPIEQISLAASRNSELLDYLLMEHEDAYTRNKSQQDLTRYLNNIVNSTPNIHSIQVYMNKQPAISDPGADVQFLHHDLIYQENWYSMIKKSDFVWLGERKMDDFRSESVITFARKIYSASLDYEGLLLINIKAKALQDILVGNSEKTTHFLLDSGGRTMLAALPVRNELKEFLREADASSGYKHYLPEGDHGGGDLVVWSRNFNEGWILLEITPWYQITSGSIKLSFTIFMVGLIAIVFSLIVTVYLSRQFTRPIKLLTKVMRKYPQDSDIQELPDDYRNEFGYLFRGYRRLMERIEQLYATLERQHRKQRKAEISALQAMINPHFLYNTLDQLNWMAIEAGHERMSRVLELMGRMFRIGLSNGQSLIPLEQELLHTESYLHIQQIRWEKGLSYDIDIPDTLAKYYVPKLTFQPFVENAIIHGFHGKMTGMIDISVTEEGEDILVNITDNGNGIPDDWRHHTNRKTGGYGIRNVQERLETYFDASYGIVIDRLAQGGTKVTIRMPKLNVPEGGESNVEDRDY